MLTLSPFSLVYLTRKKVNNINGVKRVMPLHVGGTAIMCFCVSRSANEQGVHQSENETWHQSENKTTLVNRTFILT